MWKISLYQNLSPRKNYVKKKLYLSMFDGISYQHLLQWGCVRAEGVEEGGWILIRTVGRRPSYSSQVPLSAPPRGPRAVPNTTDLSLDWFRGFKVLENCYVSWGERGWLIRSIGKNILFTKLHLYMKVSKVKWFLFCNKI